MKIRTIVFALLTAAGMLTALVLIGCAGSRQSQSDMEAAAFSGADDHRTDSEIDTVHSRTDEEEVMRLLGLAKKPDAEKESQTPATGTTVAPAADAAPGVAAGELASQSAQLEQDLQSRDLEISRLKAELAERDRRIAELESAANQPVGDRPAKPRVQSSGTYKERYDRARSLYEGRNYRQAMQEFAALISTDSKHELADNCQYWIGECHYGMRAYNQAIIEFEKVFTFNRSDKLDDALLKLGYSYLRIGNVEKAKSEFEQLINDYPDSEFAARAQHYLQQL